MIDKTKEVKLPIVFITDDRKEDWWWLDNEQRKVGPRPELIIEMQTESGVKFYMYSPDQFFQLAKDYLGLQVDQQIIREVETVSQDKLERQNQIAQSVMGRRSITGAGIARSMYSLIDTFRDRLKLIAWNGPLPSEPNNDPSSLLLSRLRSATETLQELYRVGRDLKPFIESGEEIEKILDEVSRLVQGYSIDIQSYLTLSQQASQHLSIGFDIPKTIEEPRLRSIQEIFGPGREHTLNAIDEHLDRLKEWLGVYIRANAD